MIIKDKLYNKILPKVSKPGRYLGFEWNSVHKKERGGEEENKNRIKIALAFPDIYEIAMSHLGLKILYHILNGRDDVVAERVFAPWVDMEALMRDENMPLFTLESMTPVREFDIMGFSLQYEMSFTNILNMLDMAGIPLFTQERGNDDPLIIAGGPCAFNPEPLADFIDIFVIGEGEEVILEIIDEYKRVRSTFNREELLKSLAKIPGVYVPSLYTVSYKEDGSLEGINPRVSGIPERITRRIVKDIDNAPYPKDLIVPTIQVVHDRIALEIGRGCTRGCRFCQAGMIYRPVRERNIETLMSLAEEIEKKTGYEEISLLSLSCADYSRIEELIRELMDGYEGKEISISLPSLRADAFSVALAREVQRVRKTGLTFAPEAGTQRLRNVINKGVTEDDLLKAIDAAVEAGWQNVKLYFMMGLPTETYQDLAGTGELARKVAKIKKGLAVTVSVSIFVPKAHTPFQWVAQDTISTITEKIEFLKKNVRGKGITFNWHDAQLSFLEAVFARGDRRLSTVLFQAWKMGCTFDSWSEEFDYSLWEKAFHKSGIEPTYYSNRVRDLDEFLPWDHINTGVSKAFLKNEFEKALQGELTPDCRYDKCHGCEICREFRVKPLLSSRRGGDME